MSHTATTRNNSKHLTFSVLLLMPLAYLADCALDALIFHKGTLSQQIFHPSAHDLAMRSLFGLQIVLVTLLAIYFLRKGARLERDLIRHNEELRHTIQELETFNGTLGHDLRNSLTIIYTSMEMLRDHCQIGKNTQCRFLLSSICKYSERMEAQVEGMLLLARPSQDDMPRKLVLLNELADELFEHLLPQQEPRPRITIENDLAAHCNPSLIRMALDGLLSNAINALTPGDRGEIVVGKTRQDGEPVFFVRDNGHGFEELHAESLFRGLARKAEESSMPAATIGLATIRRIIERHGGRIWAEGLPDRGATFYFTLAASD